MRSIVAYGLAILFSIIIGLATVGGIVALIDFVATPVHAAPPAPPEVEECLPVNTAKVSDVLTIMVLRCEPENGSPYLINSAGFMMPEE